LTLKFTSGTDFTTKQYLAQVVKDLKLNKQQLETNIETLSNKVIESNLQISTLSAELDHGRLEHSNELNSLKILHAKELAHEKEKFMNEKENIRSQHEKEIKDFHLKYESEVD
jgi:hypothetical protein